MMHKVLPCGKMWEHNKNADQAKKAKCKMCITTEFTEHILTECRGNGQEMIWKEVNKVLNTRGITTKDDTQSKYKIISCTFGTKDTKRREKMHTRKGNKEGNKDKAELEEVGKEHLRAKIIAEAVYLIWIMRCKWQISKNGDPQNQKTKKEAENRWKTTLGRLISTDIITTNQKKFKSKAIDKAIVQSTWRNIIESEKLTNNLKCHYVTGAPGF
jgi:hypothetical protein